MDKVTGSHSQAVPIWERQGSARGHYSSVDGALKAHRQRKVERQSRVAQRLNLVRNMQTQFFPTPQASSQRGVTQEVVKGSQRAMVQNPNRAQLAMEKVDYQAPEAASMRPMEMEEIYNEASLGSVSDAAFGVVQKEIANPEEGPIEDMPKGSYVDYTV